MSETTPTPKRRYHRRASHYRRCTRTYFRHEGRIIRLLEYTDYRPNQKGEPSREYIKRLSHRRWPRGLKMSYADSPEFATRLANLPADQWHEIVSFEEMQQNEAEKESAKEVA